MSEPFIGEVKVTSFNFAPKGWALCNGQVLPINQYQALFAVLGTLYGGDGTTTFGLPNLQGRMPIHGGRGFAVGQIGGEAAHALTSDEMPAHNHPANAQSGQASNPGGSPNNTVWAATTQPAFVDSSNTSMAAAAVSNVGGNVPHENRAPFLTLNFVIALTGIFPSRP